MGFRSVDVAAIDPLDDLGICIRESPPDQTENLTRPHARDNRELHNQSFAKVQNLKTFFYLPKSNTRSLAPARCLRRKQQQRRVALNVAFANSHFKNLAKVPPQVIDYREGEAALCLLVQEVLKLVAANARQLTIPETGYKMDARSVHVVYARGLLPLPAVIRNVDFIHELAKPPASAPLTFGFLPRRQFDSPLPWPLTSTSF